jgi:hypothetical protein
MIAHCRYNNIPGVIVSIDQAKAFDTVSHKFMHEVYKFFGLVPNFIQALETLGNNRTACIAFEDGSHSRPIKLGRGRAQGNTSSPIEYNMAEQIVIFKTRKLQVSTSTTQSPACTSTCQRTQSPYSRWKPTPATPVTGTSPTLRPPKPTDSPTTIRQALFANFPPFLILNRF